MDTRIDDNFDDEPHGWFLARCAAFVAGGLGGEERTRFERHAAECASCAAALEETRHVDAALNQLFAGVAPAAGFEDRVVQGLRHSARPQRESWVMQRWSRVHPTVRRAAVAAAAVLVVGACGYVGKDLIEQRRLVLLDRTSETAMAPATEPAADGLSLAGTTSFGTLDLNRQAPDVTKLPRLAAAADKRVLSESLAERKEAAGVEEGRGLQANALANAFLSQTSNEKLGVLKAGNATLQVTGANTYSGGTTIATGPRQVTGGGVLTLAAPPGGATVDLSANRGSSAAPVNGTAYGLSTLGAQPVDALKRTEAEKVVVAGTRVLALGDVQQKVAGEPAAVPSSVQLQPPQGGTWGYRDNTPAPKPAELNFFKLDTAANGAVAGRGLNVTKQAGSTLALGTPYKKAQVGYGGTAQGKGQAPGLVVLQLTEADERNKALAQADAAAAKTAPAPAAAEPAAAQPDSGQVQPQQPLQTQPVPAVLQRKIIRNGQVEFEVDSFDSAFIQIGKIAAEEGGFIASTDSDKLPNGKVRGTVTVRVPPDHLDVLVLKLRGLGDLKNQRLAAQDVTKQFTDFESQLRAARAMEERLLEIIKKGNGEVKDLVAAETELGKWREKIETVEGELRYYNNLISLSTLQVTMLERDVKSPTAAFETETIDAGIESDDVEKARAEALKAIDEAKGRVIDSQLKNHDAGQLSATITAEVAPEAAGPLTDRLKQLGKVVRLEATRQQTTQGGSGTPVAGVKVERRPTRIQVSLYNLANVAPRETTTVSMACTDVEAAYKAILAAVEAAENGAGAPGGAGGKVGRVVSSSLNRQNNAPKGMINLEVRADKVAMIEDAIRAAGEVMHLTVTENPDTNNVTRAKRGFVVTLDAVTTVAPRETTTLLVASRDVTGTYQRVLQLVQASRNPSRVLTAQLNEQDRQNVSGTLDVEVWRSDVPALEQLLTGGGAADKAAVSDVITRNTTRSSDADNTIDTKVRLTISLVNADSLQPRATMQMGIEVEDVDKAVEQVAATAVGGGGRVLDRHITRERSGRAGATVIVDVPLRQYDATLSQLRGLGKVRVEETSKNARIPDSPLARCQFDVTVGNAKQVESGSTESIGASLRHGLGTARDGLLWTLTVLIIGLAWIGPMALVVWGGWKLLRRGKKTGPVRL